jgi:hypothetical protein
MPVMMGTVATRRIRELGFKGFIIGCTGNALPSDTADFLAHGADMVLIKVCAYMKTYFIMGSSLTGELFDNVAHECQTV